MEASSSSSSSLISSSCSSFPTPSSANKILRYPKSRVKIASSCSHGRNRRLVVRRVAAVTDVSSVADAAGTAEITWQIIVGSIAGVAPFVVAGIEFSKRIIAQRRCQVCRGSGLVLREKEKEKAYFKCPECGGFLPWQSWKRFFTG